MRGVVLAVVVVASGAALSVTSAQAPEVVDLASITPAATLVGAAVGDQLGQVALGDVNGDRLHDIIIGAARSDGPNKERLDAGAVYLFFGTRGFSGTKDLAAGAQNVVLYGAEAFDGFGRAVASGDVNGDGVDDVIVSSQGDGPDNGRPSAGEVYIFYGGDFTKSFSVAKGQQDVTIVGADSGDDLGASIAVGDVNGDGVEDLVLGADDAAGPANGRPNAGEVYVVLGAASLGSTIDLAGGGSTAVVFGVDAGDDLGTSLATADLDGDGRADLIIGADDAGGPGNARPDAGEVYVLSGAGLSGSIDLAAGGQRLTMFGGAPGANLGIAVAAGDVNGDGRTDVVAGADGAAGAKAGQPEVGQAYVIFGGGTLSGTVDIASAQQSATIVGAGRGDRLGGALSVGDVTGDCVADLIVNASEGDGPKNGRPDAGEAYVIEGSSALSGTLSIASNAQRLTLYGADATDDLGSSLAAGYVLGDGGAEIVVAAARADGPANGRPETGEVYVIDLGDGLGCAGLGPRGGTGLGGGSAGPGGAGSDDGVRVGSPGAGHGASASAHGRAVPALFVALLASAVLLLGGGAALRVWKSALDVES